MPFWVALIRIAEITEERQTLECENARIRGMPYIIWMYRGVESLAVGGAGLENIDADTVG